MTDVHVVHNPYFQTSFQLMLDVHVPIFDLPMDNVEVTQCSHSDKKKKTQVELKVKMIYPDSETLKIVRSIL